MAALVPVGIVLSGCGSNDETQGQASGNARPEAPVPVAAQKEDNLWRVTDGAKTPAGQALSFEIRDDASARTGYLLRAGTQWLALDATCPHAGCAVNWKQNGFLCPCHNSQFTVEGKRTAGPAKRDLSRWKVRIENNDALISIS